MPKKNEDKPEKTPEQVAAAPEAAAIAAAEAPKPVPAEPAASPDDLAGIEVGDPQELVPVERPLVIKPADGGAWKNEAQAEYARYLNAYAYKNAEKWEAKKATLLKRLVEIGKNPAAIVKYRGNRGKVSFKNKLIEVPDA
jgi:hypothetical protein